jgi:hypothetical protein
MGQDFSRAVVTQQVKKIPAFIELEVNFPQNLSIGPTKKLIHTADEFI